MHHPPSHAKHCRGEFADLDDGGGYLACEEEDDVGDDEVILVTLMVTLMCNVSVIFVLPGP